MSICFNIIEYDSAHIDYPKCTYMLIHKGIYESDLRLRLDDPRVKDIKEGIFNVKISSDIHYFDDIGFPICKICGWCPIK